MRLAQFVLALCVMVAAIGCSLRVGVELMPQPSQNTDASTSSTRSESTALDPPLPGGTWVSPEPDAVVNGTINLVARAYPEAYGNPEVTLVTFTATWPGQRYPWLEACRATAPIRHDVYECTWDAAADGVPAGEVQLSFNVWDTAVNERRGPAKVRMAPNGILTVYYGGS
jgi:hypothetical protein